VTRVEKSVYEKFTEKFRERVAVRYEKGKGDRVGKMEFLSGKSRTFFLRCRKRMEGKESSAEETLPNYRERKKKEESRLECVVDEDVYHVHSLVRSEGGEVSYNKSRNDRRK